MADLTNTKVATNDAHCSICTDSLAPAGVGRYVWEDELWRLWTVLRGSVPGFSILSPKRHIPHVTDLDGREASTLGVVLARTTKALRDATGSEVVYVHVFGEGIPHLHIQLAPHHPGDALSSALLRGRVREQRLPSGATVIESLDFPERPEHELNEAADTIAKLLAEA
jgi:diadenosine tetraphosphate (Ap4A) HIT family hydrolase